MSEDSNMRNTIVDNLNECGGWDLKLILEKSTNLGRLPYALAYLIPDGKTCHACPMPLCRPYNISYHVSQSIYTPTPPISNINYSI